MLAGSRGIALGATATHPWADYREQHNIDTEHYRRVVEGLGYAARRNNTFSLHVHVGVQGADRAVRTATGCARSCRRCSRTRRTRRSSTAATPACTRRAR